MRAWLGSLVPFDSVRAVMSLLSGREQCSRLRLHSTYATVNRLCTRLHSFQRENGEGAGNDSTPDLVFHRHVNNNQPNQPREGRGQPTTTSPPSLRPKASMRMWHRTPFSAHRRFDSPGRKGALPVEEKSGKRKRGQGLQKDPRLTLSSHHITMRIAIPTHQCIGSALLHRRHGCVDGQRSGWVGTELHNVVFFPCSFSLSTLPCSSTRPTYMQQLIIIGSDL
ncbi:hypothetical protein EV127DRAFT_228131 [Xylaria flabelliformis]|nr:hypothetical protein EV127DRAFT_228131 [Xylaria flabelliformis]